MTADTSELGADRNSRKGSPEFPLVFISYSHDSPEHRLWVKGLAERLCARGIDVQFDQWQPAGIDLGRFMEQAVKTSRFVLLICTDAFVKKVEDGVGGVAYESMIVTSELMKSCHSGKFIPVVRSQSRKVPTNLSSKLWVDLVDDKSEAFEHLVETIHGLPPAGRPPIVPFASPERANNQRSTFLTKTEGERLVSQQARQVFLEAANAAGLKDSSTFRRLILLSQKYVRDELPSWRAQVRLDASRAPEHLAQFVMSCYRIFDPMIACAMAGINSHQPEYCRQAALIEDIVNQANWDGNGLVEITEVLEAIAFIYQALHGATCVMCHRYDLVTRAVATPMSLWRHRRDQVTLWEHPSIIGWPKSLGGKSTICWTFLKSLFLRIEWLEDLFVTEENFIESLVGYYIFLNLLEYGDALNQSTGGLIRSNADGRRRLSVPLAFCVEDRYLLEKATRRLLDDVSAVRNSYEMVRTVSSEDSSSWSTWSDICLGWVGELRFLCDLDDIAFLRLGPRVFNLSSDQMSW
jgi:hypothetical protein